MVTGNQNIAFHIAGTCNPVDAESVLTRGGFRLAGTTFRVCGGNHLCRMGLSPSRDIASAITAEMGPAAKAMTWALSGCPNSCTQPQLADIGIVSSTLVNEEGVRTPRFDVYRLGSEGLGTSVTNSLTLDELIRMVQGLG